MSAIRKQALSAFGSIGQILHRLALLGARHLDPDLDRSEAVRRPTSDRWCQRALCRWHAGFLRIDDAEALDDPEDSVAGLGDVHIHASMMLTGHHFSRTDRPLCDLGVVERLDHVVLLQRARLFHGSFPEPQTPVQACARTAGSELGVARIELVVPIDQVLTEWIA